MITPILTWQPIQSATPTTQTQITIRGYVAVGDTESPGLIETEFPEQLIPGDVLREGSACITAWSESQGQFLPVESVESGPSIGTGNLRITLAAPGADVADNIWLTLKTAAWQLRDAYAFECGGGTLVCPVT